MQKQITLSLLLFVMTLAVMAAAQDNASPGRALGTWKLDVQKSDFGQMPAPKSLRLRVTEDTPTALKWAVTGIGADGKAVRETFSGAADGKPYPLKGAPEGAATVAYTRAGDNDVQATMTMKNGSTVKETITMSPDNNLMTVKGEGAGSNGPMNFTEVWERVGGAKKTTAKKPAK